MKFKKDKIVFLDAGTVDYGDISFEVLQRLGNFKAYRHTRPSEMPARIRNARIVIANKCIFDRKLIRQFQPESCICLTATGVNNVELEAARRSGIAVTNVKGYSTETVVQTTFAFLLALAGNLVKYDQLVHRGTWSRSPFFTVGKYPVREVWGKTLGILGYGTIGKRVAAVGRALGMKILISRIPGRTYPRAEQIQRKPFDRVIRRADFVSIHAPLSGFTRNLIGSDVLRRMKKGAFLINVARGGIVDEKALYRALRSGHLAGAATDVLSAEPPPRNHILMKAPNLLMSPHIAWASREARLRLIREAALNIQAFQAGKSRNRVV